MPRKTWLQRSSLSAPSQTGESLYPHRNHQANNDQNLSLDRYKIGTQLGEGGQAQVYAVTPTEPSQEDEGRDWAVKMIDKRYLDDITVEQVAVEIEIQMFLSEHEGIVTLKECIISPKVRVRVRHRVRHR